MKKKYALFCILLILGCIWLLKSCESRRVKQPQQTPSNGTNSALHVVTVPKAETTNAVTDLEPVVERSIFPPQWKLSREVEHAMTKGAQARATLRVVDSTGKCVPNARVRLNFMFFERKNNFETGLTDTNGLFSAERETMSECNWFIEKEGYYNTEGRHSFAANLTNDSVKGGRWQPWNPTLEVVLKEKRKPIPMFTKYSKVFLPNKDKPFGFDCQVGDLVEPYGKGKETDLFFTYSSDLSGEAVRKYTNQLVIAASSVSGGIRKVKMDSWSEFRSVHDAPDGGYQLEIVFSCKSESPASRQEVKFSNDICLVFQSRVQTNKAGRVLSANFGKIYPMCFDYGEAPPDKGHGRVEFGYYFNPTPNDRNLEFDGKNNLFNPDWTDSWPRNP